MKWTSVKCLLFSLLCALSFNVYSEWRCYAADQGGHYWMSSGSTEERASVIALNFCTAFSPHAGSCYKSKCVEKVVASKR